jgi:hypothetical protein
MSTVYPELGPLGRELAIWEIHLEFTDKSPHTIKSYRQAIHTLGAWLADCGLPLDLRRSPPIICGVVPGVPARPKRAGARTAPAGSRPHPSDAHGEQAQQVARTKEERHEHG